MEVPQQPVVAPKKPVTQLFAELPATEAALPDETGAIVPDSEEAAQPILQADETAIVEGSVELGEIAPETLPEQLEETAVNRQTPAPQPAAATAPQAAPGLGLGPEKTPPRPTVTQKDFELPETPRARSIEPDAGPRPQTAPAQPVPPAAVQAAAARFGEQAPTAPAFETAAASLAEPEAPGSGSSAALSETAARAESAAAASRTAPVQLPQGIERQIASQLGLAVQRGGEGTIEVRLDPPELGRVSVTLTTSGDAVTALISSERPDIGEMMRRHNDLLYRELANAGFKNVTLDFGAHAQQRQGAEGQAPAEALDARDPRDQPAQLGEIRPLAAAEGGLNIRL